MLRKAQEETEAHGELNELNSLLRDFAMELVKRRVLAKMQFVRLIELSRAE